MSTILTSFLLVALVVAFLLWMSGAGYNVYAVNKAVQTKDLGNGWLKVSRAEGNQRTYHTVPKNDKRDHKTIVHEVDLSDFVSCHCAPALRTERNDEGMVEWNIIHHAYDGRELKR